MNLHELKSYINPHIYNQGFSYYIEDRVISLFNDKSFWKAEVMGSKKYTVIIELSDEHSVIHSLCDCSYYRGYYCKHQVAACLAIHETLFPSEKDIRNSEIIAESLKEQLAAEEIIKKMDLADLQNLVIKYSQMHDEFKNYVISARQINTPYSGALKEINKNIIRRYIINNCDKTGYVDYWSTKEAITGAQQLILKAEDLISEENYEEVIPICQAIIEEIAEIIHNVNDIYSHFSEAINYAFDMLNECSKFPLSEQARNDLFRYCLDQSQSKVFQNWNEWIIRFLFISARLIKTSEDENEVLMVADIHVKKNKGAGNTGTFYDEYCSMIKYEICIARNSQSFTDSFIKTNILYPAIREIHINRAIEEKNFSKAEQLALEGINEHSVRNNFSSVRKWNLLLEQIFVSSKNISKLKEQAEYNFLNYHTFDSFCNLKKYSDNSEWTSIKNRIIEKLRGSIQYKHILPEILSEIFIFENDKKNLLGLIEQYPIYTTDYIDYLIPEYKDQISDIYAKHILFEIQFAASKIAYKNIAQIFLILINIGDQKRARDIANQLKNDYPNNLDMHSEIESIFFNSNCK